MLLIEHQPELFDNAQMAAFRFELDKIRKSMFVRYNLLEKRIRELEQENTILKSCLCNGLDERSLSVDRNRVF